ncbi:allophanate hydrolase subunit 1 [Pseudomonas sp. NPDC088444]|uniref:5-oxoprolinase subunit B family protein n=1 Tax=Pseudomonas sp. NPDC088444 TaxID=3364456 RepID=UPI00384BDA74
MFYISAHAPSAPVPDLRPPARSWRFEPCGERCVILVFDSVFSIEANREAASVANILRTLASQGALPGITDVVAAMVTVGVHYSPLAFVTLDADASPYDVVCQALSAALLQSIGATVGNTNRIEIPVCYESEYAPDLAAIAQACALTVDEVIAAHTADWLDVLMVGFAPGHPYIGLHPQALSLPRRSVPRKRVAKGSVGIANGQSVIYPAELPGGWNLVGRTPLDLFSPFNDVPCLLKGGDQVRFTAISSREFEALARGESL